MPFARTAHRGLAVSAWRAADAAVAGRGMTEGFVVKVPLPLLLALAYLALLPLPVPAEPPEGVSGKMVLDEVSEGLRKYRQEADEARRSEWLRRLAPSRDPRVALELWEVFAWVRGRRTAAIRTVARDCLAEHYATKDGRPLSDVAPSEADRGAGVCSWWSKNGPDLRRRARELPR